MKSTRVLTTQTHETQYNFSSTVHILIYIHTRWPGVSVPNYSNWSTLLVKITILDIRQSLFESQRSQSFIVSTRTVLKTFKGIFQVVTDGSLTQRYRSLPIRVIFPQGFISFWKKYFRNTIRDSIDLTDMTFQRWVPHRIIVEQFYFCILVFGSFSDERVVTLPTVYSPLCVGSQVNLKGFLFLSPKRAYTQKTDGRLFRIGYLLLNRTVVRLSYPLLKIP